MALSNSQYNSIMRDYERRRMENRHEQEKRVEEIYQKIPAIKEIDNAVGAKALERARPSFWQGIRRRNQLKNRQSWASERAALLTAYGLSGENYMELRYTCRDCQDTGYADGKKCHCFRRAQMKLLYAQSNIDEIVNRENFASFSYRMYFDKQPHNPRSRDDGSPVYKRVNFASGICQKVWNKTEGIFCLPATPAWERPFLTNCIAKEVMDAYYSVFYICLPTFV